MYNVQFFFWHDILKKFKGVLFVREDITESELKKTISIEIILYSVHKLDYSHFRTFSAEASEASCGKFWEVASADVDS